mmetsp:Transcript_4222/g.7291  ORF Transcript_4222/g.7291 Transcript_4222/m.7291 type:complete len:190 (-) Transcript_4222:17-586(-)
MRLLRCRLEDPFFRRDLRSPFVSALSGDDLDFFFLLFFFFSLDFSVLGFPSVSPCNRSERRDDSSLSSSSAASRSSASSSSSSSPVVLNFLGSPVKGGVRGGSTSSSSSSSKKAFQEMRNLASKFGLHGETHICQIAYDPKYGIPTTLAECTREHGGYNEDLFATYMETTQLKDNWHVIGKFADQVYRD